MIAEIDGRRLPEIVRNGRWAKAHSPVLLCLSTRTSTKTPAQAEVGADSVDAPSSPIQPAEVCFRAGYDDEGGKALNIDAVKRVLRLATRATDTQMSTRLCVELTD